MMTSKKLATVLIAAKCLQRIYFLSQSNLLFYMTRISIKIVQRSIYLYQSSPNFRKVFFCFWSIILFFSHNLQINFVRFCDTIPVRSWSYTSTDNTGWTQIFWKGVVYTRGSSEKKGVLGHNLSFFCQLTFFPHFPPTFGSATATYNGNFSTIYF